MLRIGLAALRQPACLSNGVEKINGVLVDCKKKQVDVICFPETYLPGLRGASFEVPEVDQQGMERALTDLRRSCRENGVMAIVGLEWLTERGLENRAVVISASGRVLGHQTKNQITPGGESEHYVPDGARRIFKVKGVPFGIVICHEGWRYPETVRWAVLKGAKVIFQPQVTGSDQKGKKIKKWGEAFYEKSMQCRAGENNVFFASVNQAMTYQNSATSLIDPKGNLMDYLPYGKEGLLVADLDMDEATRVYAKRYNPALYPKIK